MDTFSGRTYRIQPIEVDGYADADAVFVSRDGAFLGEWCGEESPANCYIDADGDYIPAPSNWRELIVAQ